jgi:hypothetical protein
VSARAHDLWLVSDSAVSADESLRISAHVGEEFPVSEYGPDPAAFKRRILIRPDGTEGVLQPKGTKDNSGLLQFEPSGPGIYGIAVETEPKLIMLEPEAFNLYLITDGLPHIFRLRAKEKTLHQPAHERYSKYPKALVKIGSGNTGDPSRVLGLLLEIVPLRDPFALRPSDTLPVRELFRGMPLPEAYVGWQHPGDGANPRGAIRTDARGEALVPISRAGLMAVRLTHMTRPKSQDYEWESFWTTLTFRVPE